MKIDKTTWLRMVVNSSEINQENNTSRLDWYLSMKNKEKVNKKQCKTLVKTVVTLKQVIQRKKKCIYNLLNGMKSTKTERLLCENAST